MKNVLSLIVSAGLVASLAMLAGCGKKDNRASAKGEKLYCYASEIMLYPMEKIAKLYKEKTGVEVEMEEADCGELLTRIRQRKTGDLYVSHDPFLAMLMAKGLGSQSWNLAVLTPVILVPKGNPKHIESVKDLARPGVKLGLTDPNYSTAGHIVPFIFKQAGVPESVAKNANRAREGGNIAQWVVTGTVDAAITWNAVAYYNRDKVDEVPINPKYMPVPGVDAVTSATDKKYDIGRVNVTIATLKCSKQSEAAKKFAEFASAHTDIFVKDFGYSPPAPQPAATTSTAAAADVSTATGEIWVHCGAGLRPAMEDAIKAFEAKTGAKIEASYQGSGTLITSIKLKHQGDLYMPGDSAYLDQLAADGSVLARRDVAWLTPVIIVAKGNPKKIESLADLARPGVSLGLGNPDACQVGRLCEQLWKKDGIDPAAIKNNTAYSSMTVNELGVKVQTGSVDAAIVWDAVARKFTKNVDIIPIPPKENIYSHVAIGLLKYTQNEPLARRFMDWLAGPEGKAIFKSHHYTTEAPAA